jgi:hypothetical protein
MIMLFLYNYRYGATLYLSVLTCINSLFCQLVLGVKRSSKIGQRQDTKVASESTLLAYQDRILGNRRTVSEKPC